MQLTEGACQVSEWVVCFTDEGINNIDIYLDCLRTLHTQAVTEAISNYTPNGVLGTPPPDISPLESLLPRSVRTTLAQRRSGHCRLLISYMARITTACTGVPDVCPECGVAPHSVEHLFNCSAHPTQLTVQDLWDNPAEVADFLNLDSWRQWTRREELLGYHNNNSSLKTLNGTSAYKRPFCAMDGTHSV